MKKGMRPLIVGNWKMNPQTLSLAVKLVTSLKKKLVGKKLREAEVVIAPPYVHLESIKKLKGTGNKQFSLGAQNVHPAKLGAFTGEVSVPMLKDLGVSYVIVGHSERRALGEKDEFINKKLHAVLKAGLAGIVCVGESKRDHAGQYLSYIENQVRAALLGIPKAKLPGVVIAYEPLWAIGTGHNDTPHNVHEMSLFIEKVIAHMYGRNYAQKVRIIYGGSVNKRNARELYHEGMMSGFLVGGASLHADEFIEIIKATQGK